MFFIIDLILVLPSMIMMGSLLIKLYVHKEHGPECTAKNPHIYVWMQIASQIVSGILSNLNIVCDVAVASLALSYSKWLSSLGRSEELHDQANELHQLYIGSMVSIQATMMVRYLYFLLPKLNKFGKIYIYSFIGDAFSHSLASAGSLSDLINEETQYHKARSAYLSSIYKLMVKHIP